MKPMHATMATRPCLSSAARYHVRASGEVLANPNGSQNPKGAWAPSICDASKALATVAGRAGATGATSARAPAASSASLRFWRVR